MYFVIDTDKYSGNFERELCAYITGQTGDCGVGQKIKEHVYSTIPKDKIDTFENLIGVEPDEHGCYRPVKIYTTPGIYNNGMGFHYKEGEENKALVAFPAYQSVAICLNENPNQKIINYMKQRAEEYAKICKDGGAENIGGSKYSNGFNITGYRLVIEKVTTKEEKL